MEHKNSEINQTFKNKKIKKLWKWTRILKLYFSSFYYPDWTVVRLQEMLRWKMNPALENRSTVDQLMITDAEKQWSFIASCRKKLFLQKIVWAYMKNVCLRDSINVAVKKVYFATVKILKIFCWFLKIRFAALEHWNEDFNSSILLFQAFLSSITLYFFCLTVTFTA